MFKNVLFHDNMNSNIDFFNPLENPYDKSRVIYCFASPFVIEPITRDFFFYYIDGVKNKMDPSC
jgi:hypothetical protein